MSRKPTFQFGDVLIHVEQGLPYYFGGYILQRDSFYGGGSLHDCFLYQSLELLTQNTYNKLYRDSTDFWFPSGRYVLVEKKRKNIFLDEII